MTRYEDFKRRDDRRPEPIGTIGDLFGRIQPVLPPVKHDDEPKEE